MSCISLRLTCVAHSKPSSTHSNNNYRALRVKRIHRTILSLQETVNRCLEDEVSISDPKTNAETWNIISTHASYIQNLYLELSNMDE